MQIAGKSEFIGKSYLQNAIQGFSLGHWVSDISGDKVEPHGHQEAHIMFITGGDFVSNAVGEPSKKYPLMVYNPPQTFHSDRFISKTGSFFTISLKANLFQDFYEAPLPQIPTAVANPIPLEKQIPKWLKNAFEMLQDSFTQELSIKNISQAVGVHPIHLTRSFQAFYRCTPGEFLHNLRLQKAAELLVTTKLSLAEIALESGFFDQSHLTKHFRRIYGVPPGEFRNISN